MASQGITDLMTALQGFNNGLKSLQTSRVLNNANEAVEQIRASDADAQQKKAQIRGIADQLTMKLVGLGGSVEEATRLGDLFNGPKQPTFQSAEQMRIWGVINNDPLAVKAAKDIAQDEYDMKALAAAEADKKIIDRMKLSEGWKDENNKIKADAQLEKERRATLVGKQQEYNKIVNKLDESLRFAKTGQDLLASDDARRLIGPVRFLAIRASGSAANFSDKEGELLSGYQDLLSQFKQMIGTKAQSDFIKENKQAFGELFNIYTQNGEEFKREIEPSSLISLI